MKDFGFLHVFYLIIKEVQNLIKNLIYMKCLLVLPIKSRRRMIKFATIIVLLLSICMPDIYAEGNNIQDVKQTKTVTGIVKDDSGEGLIGVSIQIKGASTGTVTNLSGEFTLEIPSENAILVFSYIGYKAQEITVANRTHINVILESDIGLLDEVVVVGYGVQKKKLVTGATVQVKGDDVQKLNTVNVLGALQSQTPGVNITQQSGMPGEGFKVTIRGLGTVGDSDPLYIIDGSPGGDINSLNPADIESIDVLKDAASAAIYGSRAANGVILVTTKQGRAGKMQVSFDGYYGVQNVYRMPQILNAQEYTTIVNEARLMDGLSPYNFEKDVPNWASIQNGSWKGTNFLDLSRNKNAPTQNYALNMTGGSEQAVYSVGFGYTSQEGILGKPSQTEYERYTARVNSEFILYKKGNLDVVKFGENLTYSYAERAKGIAIGDMWYNDIRNMIKTTPYLPNLDENGEYHTAIPWDIRTANPLAEMETRSHNLEKNHRLKANLFLTVQPIKGLIFKTNFGYVVNAGSYRSYKPAYNLSSTVLNTLESVNQSMWTGTGFTWENTLTYSFDINEKHNINALIGQSIEKTGMDDTLEATNGNPIFHDFKHAYIRNTPFTEMNAASAMDGTPGEDRTKLASFFGRINYDYNNKYMATVVLRADGSSNFAKGHRWGYFPSVSAGWIMTSEPFMESALSVVDFLKLRVSWGQNGNQAIDPFQYLAPIATTDQYTFGNNKGTPSVGSYPRLLPNKEVSWEISDQTNLGIDARFLNSRLGLTFDYYIKKTKDWLVVAPQLASFGTGAPFINGGDIENKGVEFSLNWNDQINDFKYGANVNFTHNKNKVTRLDNSEGIIPGKTDIIFQGSTESYRAQVGYPVGFFYGYKSAGIFQSQQEVDDYKGPKLPGAREGDVIWVDRNNDKKITSEDQDMIGNPHPDFNLGIGLNASYKGLDLSVTMSGAFGHQILRSYRSWSDSPLDNYTSEIFGRWHGEGTSNRFPRLSTNVHTNRQYVSDLYIENGDYLRMQNITLGYDFKKLFPRMALQQARIYVSAQNLFTITKYQGMDPEVGFGAEDPWASGIDVGFYPSPRTYIIGVNLKF